MLAEPIPATVSVNRHRLGSLSDVMDALQGHAESQPETTQPQSLNSAAKEKLRQFISRIERLEDEKTELAGQLKEVYGEAKSLGFDTKAIRAVIRARKQDARERDEAQMVFDLYWDVVSA
jgi:uncharacterized protein (UPF0335 family)